MLRMIILGNNAAFVQQLTVLQHQPIGYQILPAQYPPDKLTFFEPFGIIVFQCDDLDAAALEAIAAIRRQYPHIPLVAALPANTPSVQLNLAYRNGVSDCLFEPFQADELLATLRHFAEPEPTVAGVLHFAPSGINQLLKETWGDTTADISARMLGVFGIGARGKRFDLPLGPRQRSLLAYLLHHGTGARIPRDRIIQQFWPDHDTASARNCLHVNLANLRRYLTKYLGNREVICFREESCFIHPALKVWKDTDIFLQYFHRGKTAEREGRYDAAVQEYNQMTQFGAEFLEDLRQENWATWPRDEFSEKYIHALLFLADRCMQARRFDQAREHLRRILQKDDCLESVHQQVIRCYKEEGQPEQAARHLRECERIFREKLRADLSPATRRLMMNDE